MNPQLITSWFCNEIPIIETHGGCFVMKHVGGSMEVDVDKSITTNLTCCFVKNNVNVDVMSTDVHTNKCSGVFCDRQRSLEISRGTRACGCYSMNIRVSSIVLLHRIDVSKGGIHLFSMDDFSSLNFRTCICSIHDQTNQDVA